MYSNEYRPPNGFEPGKNPAVTSLVMGILATICLFGLFVHVSSLLALVFGIIGLVEASKSKRMGYFGPMRTAGFILSLVGTVGGGVLVALVFL